MKQARTKMRNPESLSADDILRLPSLDSLGFVFASMAWLDYYRRHKSYGSLLCAATTARQGIEYLLFELLLLSVENGPTEEEYATWLKDGTATGLRKQLTRAAPDFEKLQSFSAIVASIEDDVPDLVTWNISDLLRAWGISSEFLHWNGAYSRTSSDTKWRESSFRRICETVNPIWEKMKSARLGVIRPSSMEKNTKEVWDDYRQDRIDEAQVKLRLELLRPVCYVRRVE